MTHPLSGFHSATPITSRVRFGYHGGRYWIIMPMEGGTFRAVFTPENVHLLGRRYRRRGVTVTQYDGPTMRFDTAQQYGRWLLHEGVDPDLAVDLHETWDEPRYAAVGQQVIDSMFTAAGY
jgi:hypothetical protein